MRAPHFSLSYIAPDGSAEPSLALKDTAALQGFEDFGCLCEDPCPERCVVASNALQALLT